MRPRRGPVGQWRSPHAGKLCRLSTRPKRLLIALVAMLLPLAAAAQKSTVCTITVNSADEREAFRRNLPEDKFDFVELVEHGRPDWLRSACAKKIRCDVLLISGHFAGTEFYSSQPVVNESLPVDELERVSCGGSCPQLFSHLKEVYLFGCDTLKAEPVRSAMPEIVRALLREGRSRADAERVARACSEREAESASERMRRIFANVPVIYGFASLAPYGRTAGPLLERYFDAAPTAAVGTGRPSERLLKLFAPSRMVATSGMTDADPNAASRAEACRFYGDRTSPAAKLAQIHRLMGEGMPRVRIAFDRIEKFFGAIGNAERTDPAFAAALRALAGDGPLRARYLGITRETGDPALRVRMIALALAVGWLTPAERHAELARTVADVIARRSMGFGDVELVCGLNRDRTLDDALARVKRGAAESAPQAAGLACLGSVPDRARVLRLLASPREADVRAAQAYLRHRPITDTAELRAAAREIARMKATAAQVRALDALGRLHLADPAILAELARLFARTPSLAVQRAIAEVYLRADPNAVDPPKLVDVLRRHRLRSPDGEDLIDVVVRSLS